MGAYTTATADFDTLQNIVRTLKSGYFGGVTPFRP